MAKSERPEWFKFWRRNRQMLDIDQLSMESRGRIFTNMMRYFDSGEDELLSLDTLESAMFNVLKINVDNSFSDFEETSQKNRENALKRWNATASDRIRSNAIDAEDRGKKIEDRRENTEDRGEREEDRSPAPAPPTVEDVREYCLAEGIADFRTQRFVDYYAARNWKAKGEPVSDWKALVRVWADRDREEQKPAHVTTFMDLPDERNEEREQRRKELGLDW